ncbi:VOC family protein [Bacillus sp. JJ1122]|uniref:VOC family protein n=1 Tax=Bacillus sp. JJ1122 TaxID=3122951 RepID=UPI002FFDFE46
MLHHIEMNVSDLSKTTKFWEWFLSELNYKKFQKWDRGISWKFENTYLVFVQTEERFLEAGYHRSQIGLNHLAFHAQSRDKVDDITRKLKNMGIPILYMDKHPFAGGADHYAVFFEDPDRIKVELVAP